MTRFSPLVLTLPLLLLLHATTLRAEVIDRVVAVVNDDVITLSEINEEGKAIFQKVAEQYTGDELQKALEQARAAVIRKMIDQLLLTREAEKRNIQVRDEEVEAAFQQVLHKNHMTREQLMAQLAASGITEERYRADLKKQILGSRLVQTELRSKIVIPEKEIQAYYEDQYSDRLAPGEFYILQIGCTVPAALRDTERTAQMQKALDRAERLRMLALGGNDFKELAQKYSDLPSAADGGDIGLFKEDEMAPYMFEAIHSLKPGDVSNVVETPDGYQFYKLLSSRKGGTETKVPLESVRNEIYEILFREKMKTEYEEWLKNLHNQAYIKIL